MKVSFSIDILIGMLCSKVIGVLVHATHACECNGYGFFFNRRVNWSVTSARKLIQVPAVVPRAYK